MFRLSHFRQSQLTRRLLFYTVVCIFMFSLIATVSHLIFRCHHARQEIENNFRFIKSSYIESIGASLFSLDEEQLRFQFKGILNLPHIAYVGVKEKRGADWIQFSEGDAQAPRDIVHTYPLAYRLVSRKPINIGVLTVSASLENVWGLIWINGFFASTIIAVGVGLMAICIFLIFQNTVTRHLIKMGLYTDQLNLNDLDAELVLDRKPHNLWQADELSGLAAALNEMRLRLKTDLQDLQTMGEALRRSEFLFRAITEQAGEGICLADTNQNFISAPATAIN